jgi:hypothetical protein
MTYPDAGERKLIPVKVVPAPKSLFKDVMLEVPKNNASPGAAAPAAPLPPTQFPAFQKLLVGLALHVALAPRAK